MSTSVSASAHRKHYRLSQSSPLSTAPTGPTGTSSSSTPSDANNVPPDHQSLRNALLAFLLCSMIVVGLVYAIHRSGLINDTPDRGAPPNPATPIPTVAPKQSGTNELADALRVSVVVTVAVPYPVIQERPVVYYVQPPAYIPPSTPIYHGVVHHHGYGCAGAFTYCVRPGDTVYGLARRFGTSPQAVISANGLWNPNYIRVGQLLQIPCAAPY